MANTKLVTEAKRLSGDADVVRVPRWILNALVEEARGNAVDMLAAYLSRDGLPSSVEMPDGSEVEYVLHAS